MVSGNAVRRLLSVNKIAEDLDVSPLSIRREIYAGRLGAVRIGRAVRVEPTELERWLETRRVPAAAVEARA